MVKIAFVFPGQGSQFVGMGKPFHDTFPMASTLYQEANEVLGLDLASICFNGPEENLMLTANAQPAILIHSIIALKQLGESGIDAVLTAGHSLGEYSALVAAGSLKFLDAVKLVQLRGRFMQEAVPVGVGGMAAILGIPWESVRELCGEISTGNFLVQPANWNSAEQLVVAVHKEAVEIVCAKAEQAGAKRTVILPVSAPFHCYLMKTAEVKLQNELERTDFQELSFPVITNIEAKTISQGHEAREALRKQVCSPVRWAETMQFIWDQGIRTVVELGPGKVLSGLMRRFNKEINCYQIEDPESLDRSVAALKQS